MYALQSNITVTLEVTSLHLLHGEKEPELFGHLYVYSLASKLLKSQIQYSLILPRCFADHSTLTYSFLFSYFPPQILRQS